MFSKQAGGAFLLPECTAQRNRYGVTQLGDFVNKDEQFNRECKRGKGKRTLSILLLFRFALLTR
ncbi:MAG: hypothetical protein CSB34_03835 [Desulfobulbus propionicus]|nr:MAG: hypothetical protein CSB34_03835 [Desulfobulbus propionicus]